MYRAQTLIASAVVAACSAWPLAAQAQTSGTTADRGSGVAAGAGSTSQATPSGSSPSTLGFQSGAMTDAEWESGRAARYSLLPYTSYGYVGLNLGRANWGDSCDGFSGIFNCDDSAFAGKIYTGGLISRMVGLEVGYINFGRPETAFGDWKAHGINASIVANLPVDPVNLFARFGTTYGWTDTPGGPGVAGGEDSGFGIAYGAGIGLDVTPQMQVTLEWDRNRFNFVSGDQDLDMYSLGVRYKF
jgi:opacity protein-like surface antigen